MKKIILLSVLAVGISVQSVDASSQSSVNGTAPQALKLDGKPLVLTTPDGKSVLLGMSNDGKLELLAPPPYPGAKSEQYDTLDNKSHDADVANSPRMPTLETSSVADNRDSAQKSAPQLNSVDIERTEEDIKELETYQGRNLIKKPLRDKANGIIERLTLRLSLNYDDLKLEPSPDAKSVKAMDLGTQLAYVIKVFKDKLAEIKGK